MEDDFISGLTRQVKEEVIENYVLERRLLELQIEHLREQARRAREIAENAGSSLACLAFLMRGQEMRARLKQILNPAAGSFWSAFLDQPFDPEKRPAPVRGLTRKGRFRKLVVLSCNELTTGMKTYREVFDETAAECGAVNINIDAFHRNFDLLAILNFFRTLDVRSLERKNILGENFTAREMAELDRNLYIRPMAFEKLGLPSPLDLPEPRSLEHQLLELANAVYTRYGKELGGIV